MADTTPAPAPALPSTADETPYVPVSWMAVAAAAAAAAFVLILLVLGVSAFVGKKPLLVDELLVLPVVGIILCFAARRMIRNAEGTRTGENLVSAAWWVCLVGGLGYTAYLLGVSFSVRRDAAGEAERWAGYLASPEENNNLNRAFLRTREPGRRAGLSPDDTATLVAQFRDEYLAFGQCDLARLARRNPGGAFRFVPGAIKDWVYKPGMIDCTYAASVACPEGTFPLEVPLKGVEAGVRTEGPAGRQWMVTLPQNGYFVREKCALTPYGWRVNDLERAGGAFGRAFVQQTGAVDRAYLYQTLVNPDPKAAPAVLEAAFLLTALRARNLAPVHPAAVFLTPDYQTYVQNQFLRQPGGGEVSADKKAQFLKVWNEYGLLLPGRRLPGNDKIDANDALTVSDAAVEVRVPCEVPLPGAGGNLSAARGRVVVRCDDPEVLAELKTLRDAAKPDQGTVTRPDEPARRPARWRVVRVESDMHEVRVAPQGQGGPGGPGG